MEDIISIIFKVISLNCSIRLQVFKELLHSYYIIQLYMTRKRTTINETRPDQTGINQVIHDTFYTYSWYPLLGMHSTVHTLVGSSVCRPKKTSSILWAHSARRRNRIHITVNDGHNDPAIPFFAFWMSFFC